jgi:phosphatidylglycerophosphate synthase
MAATTGRCSCSCSPVCRTGSTDTSRSVSTGKPGSAGCSIRLELTSIVVGRDVVIVLGALCYQFFIAPVEGQPAAISKLNTACQLAMLFFTLTSAAYAWPPDVSLLVLGAAVVFTSIVSGLTYVLNWSVRAWRVAHSAG